MATITKTQKQADIRYRVELKQSRLHLVIYKVRSSDDTQDYDVTLVDGKVNNCTCKATKPCYHMRDCQAREDARRQAAEAQAMNELAAEMAAESEQAAPEADTRYYPSYRAGGQWNRFSERGRDVSFATERDAQAYLQGVVGETRVEVAEVARPIEERGNLNGGGRAFSLLR